MSLTVSELVEQTADCGGCSAWLQGDELNLPRLIALVDRSGQLSLRIGTQDTITFTADMLVMRRGARVICTLDEAGRRYAFDLSFPAANLQTGSLGIVVKLRYLLDYDPDTERYYVQPTITAATYQPAEAG